MTNKPSIKALFIGSVDMSKTALEVIMDTPGIDIVGVVTKAQSNFNADHADLTPLANNLGCDTYHFTLENKNNLKEWIAERSPDVIFCIGWSHLLSEDIIDIPPLGVIGYHPSALPKNRGRHPIIWALALGLKETASTYFMIDKGVDSGDIVKQTSLAITQEDDANTLYEKLTELTKVQVREICQELVDGTLEKTPQDISLGNEWRKRGKPDGEIDWRMSAESIHNLVRALTKPYVGAHFYYQGKEYIIWKAKAITQSDKHIEPGKIIAVEGKEWTVKCGHDALTVVEDTMDAMPKLGEYINV